MRRMCRPSRIRWTEGVCVALAVSLTACGNDGAPNPSVVKAEGPPRDSCRRKFGPFSVLGRLGSPEIEFSKPGSEEVVATLRTGSAGVLAFANVERDGRGYLLVSEIDAERHLVLSRFHDADGDGIPDASTRRVLLTSGGEVLFIGAIAVRSSAVLYLWDGRCGDVLVAVDADGDGWVDRLKPRRFARSDEHVDLISCDLRYRYETATKHHLVYVTHEFDREIEQFRMPYRILKDVDGDDICDSDDEVVLRDRRPSLQRGELTDGASRIELLWDARGGAGVIEAWLLDAGGADRAKLGEVFAPKGSVSADLVLEKPLVAGWRVGLRVRGEKPTERIYDVFPVWPVAESAVPDRVPAGVASEVTIHGTAFTALMSVRLARGGALEPLEFTLIDSTSARVRVPAQHADFGIVAVGPGQRTDDSSHPLRAVDVRVRAP